MSSAQLSAVFFFQIFFILAVCRCVGILARRVGQPQVVGEMIAGVIMGPSLFGLLFPTWQQVIFPKDSLKILYVLAQFGVGLYMFLVGTEFKVDLFRSECVARLRSLWQAWLHLLFWVAFWRSGSEGLRGFSPKR
jgi:Kef-type K+ transport system membrane component KefB